MASVTPSAAERTASNRTTRIVIGIAVLLAGVAALLAVLSSANMSEATETFDGVAVIELDLENSPVEVVVGESNDVVVEKSFTTGFLGGSNRTEQDGDTLRLIQSCPPILGFGCRATYSLAVPAEVAIIGGTSNGLIKIEGLEGPIDVSTSNGRVELDEVSGRVRADTSNGAITGTGLASVEVDFSTSNGRVSLAFDEPPRAAGVRTSNGAVDVVVPADSPPYALATSTSNGDVVTDIRTDTAAADNSIDISTSNGDITVRYP